jgi:hypothetical protein
MDKNLTRAITNDDLWAATRGLGMARMGGSELKELYDAHCKSAMFAGQVIAQAALDMAAIKGLHKDW